MKITTFNFDDAVIRVASDDKGDVWFVATDICAALGFANPRQAIETHVDSEDVQKLDTLTSGGRQQQNHVNESGLYALIFGSTKPEAKRFKKWVTSEVLPSIRQHGAYVSEGISREKSADLLTGLEARFGPLSGGGIPSHPVSPSADLASAVNLNLLSKRSATGLWTEWFRSKYGLTGSTAAAPVAVQKPLELLLPPPAPKKTTPTPIPRINAKRTAPDGVSLVLSEVADYAGAPESDLLRCMVARKLCDASGVPTAQGRSYSLKSRGRVHWHVGKLLARLHSDK